MTKKERDALMQKARQEQGGICPICHYGNFCLGCVRNGGHEGPCEYQTLNTFDHNHDCCKKGCEKCFRGALHSWCNRYLPLLERHPHLQTPEITIYLQRGKPVELKG